MYLRCCHRKISIEVRPDVRDGEGEPTYSICELGAPLVIALDRCTPRENRREFIVHELGHIWDHVAGKVDPNDGESPHNRQSAIDAQFSADLDEQGGELAIHALFGDAEADILVIDSSTEDDQRVAAGDDDSEWPTRVSCPHCKQSNSSRMVRNGTPAFDPRVNGFVMWRILRCASADCERRFRWQQRCTYSGEPLPDVTAPPMLLREMQDA